MFVSSESVKAVICNNPMTADLDGGAYGIDNVASIVTGDIITDSPQVDVRYYGAVGNGTETFDFLIFN